MRIASILIIARLLILSVIPTAALAYEAENGTFENKETALLKIESGNIKDIQIDNSVLSGQVEKTAFEQKKTESKKLSAQEKRVLAYQKKLESYDPPEGKIEILATGYSSTVDQCDGDPFTTASGSTVHRGTIACPPQYPFGTKVEIDGMGTFTCEDRGGAIKGNHFDIWFETRAQALEWGKRTVLAEISK